MGFDPKLHQLILFGGQGADGQPLGDTWAWNGASWYEQTDSLVSHAPGAREGAAMGYDGAGHLVLFGGTGVAVTAPAPTTSTTTPGGGGAPTGVTASTGAGPLTVLADTWLWSGTGWSPSKAVGPPARSGAALALNGARSGAVLFGGESTPAPAASPKLLHDSWAWNGAAWVPVAGAVYPSGRDHAVMVPDSLTGGVVLFGGAGAQGALGDTWLWNGSAWAPARTAGSPSARVGAAAAFDSSSHELVVFGGIGPGGHILGDTVILTGQAPVTLGAGTTPTTRPISRTSPSVAPPVTASPPANLRPTAGPGSTSTSIPVVGVGPESPQPNAPLPALHRGELVKLSGQGFQAGTAVVITFHSTSTVVGRTKTTTQGTFSLIVPIPEAAAGGTHHFEAAGLGPSGPMAELIATVDVVGILGLGAMSPATQRLVLTASPSPSPPAPGASWWSGVGGGAGGRPCREGNRGPSGSVGQLPEAGHVQHPDAPAGQIHHAGLLGAAQGPVDRGPGATGH